MPGSNLYFYLYFMDRFRRLSGAFFTEEERALYHDFRKRFLLEKESNQIEARMFLLFYDRAQTDSNR